MGVMRGIATVQAKLWYVARRLVLDACRLLNCTVEPPGKLACCISHKAIRRRVARPPIKRDRHGRFANRLASAIVEYCLHKRRRRKES